MPEQMDEHFAAALRTLLLKEVSTPEQAVSWFARQRRKLVGVGAALVIAAGGGGLAYAAGAFGTAPGATVTTPLASTRTFVETGTQTVDLGPRPADANGVAITLSCLSEGTFRYPDGAGVICNTRQDVREAVKREPAYSVSLVPGQNTITITATPGAKWRATTTYVTLAQTPWQVNASGQTYGVENQTGTPDLVAAYASNHRLGYVYASQLNGPTPKTPAQAVTESGRPRRPIPVYESDGKTQIGVFEFSQPNACTLTRQHTTCPHR